MIHHVGFKVSDYAASKAFYGPVLAPLDHGLVMEVTPEMIGGNSHHAASGANGKPDFWIGSGQSAARSRADVDVFHAAALAAGSRDNGAHGLRPLYHPNYYGAFVIDADDHNIEAVCHAPEAHG